MTIQFSCVSCGKPIEIDNDWARRLVECPYCHDTVTAPGISTYSPSAQKTASEATVPHQAVATYPPVAIPVTSPAVAQNRLAVVALILACASFGLLMWIGISLTNVLADRLDPNATSADVQRLLQNALDQQEPWAYRMTFGCLGWFGLWVAALVCSIVALCRPRRRGTALAALLLSVFPIFLMLIGIVGGG